MQCPRCGADDDKVIDSRSVDDARAIRRRRSCLSCAHRFTTFERIETAELVVAKRSGDRVPFDAERIVAGVRAASKNRPVAPDDMQELAIRVEDTIRADGLGVVTTERIGIEVLEGLRELDQVAYLRFASVYKEFADAADFAREARLLTKLATPKNHDVAALVPDQPDPARSPGDHQSGDDQSGEDQSGDDPSADPSSFESRPAT